MQLVTNTTTQSSSSILGWKNLSLIARIIPYMTNHFVEQFVPFFQFSLAKFCHGPKIKIKGLYHFPEVQL